MFAPSNLHQTFFEEEFSLILQNMYNRHKKIPGEIDIFNVTSLDMAMEASIESSDSSSTIGAMKVEFASKNTLNFCFGKIFFNNLVNIFGYDFHFLSV